MDPSAKIARFADAVARLRAEIGKSVVGQQRVVGDILVCLLAGGHALLEGAPGLGKTLLVRTLARCLALRFSRIQFTPDLMPADITGTNILLEEGRGGRRFEFQRGPIFGNVVLADEINRATPKTQSALLEAMSEEAVTVAGVRHPLEPPLIVLATQNPIEMEGTYPLPEAQLDRFLMKILVDSPDAETMVKIVESTTGGPGAEPEPVLDGPGVLSLRALVRETPIAAPLLRYAANLVRATQPEAPEAAPVARKYVRYGAGVRAAQALVLGAKARALLDGRVHVSFDDIAVSAKPCLRHRLVLGFEGEAEGIAPDAIIDRVLESLPRLPDSVTRLGR